MKFSSPIFLLAATVVAAPVHIVEKASDHDVIIILAHGRKSAAASPDLSIQLQTSGGQVDGRLDSCHTDDDCSKGIVCLLEPNEELAKVCQGWKSTSRALNSDSAKHVSKLVENIVQKLLSGN
ncbi:hypothetical protein TWF281_009260 [Arthrobotrys megalospora]